MTLNSPPFLGQGWAQFTACEVDDRRQIAVLRIHVERAIARLRYFRILRGTIPITPAPLANHIVTFVHFLPTTLNQLLLMAMICNTICFISETFGYLLSSIIV